MEILGPCFHYSAGNAAPFVLLRVEKWSWHAEPAQGVALQEATSQCREWDVEAHTYLGQNQESLLMSGRASETAVIDEKGGKFFRETCAVAVLCSALAKSFSKETPWSGAQSEVVVSSRGCFLSRSSSAWIESCLVQDDWLTESFTTVRIWSLDMLSCQPGKPQYLHVFEKQMLVFCRHFYCYNLVLC